MLTFFFFFFFFFFLMSRRPPRSTRETTPFPTRRSSDLAAATAWYREIGRGVERGAQAEQHRSEEHTSELQSQSHISYAVVCLKKKKQRLLLRTLDLRAPVTICGALLREP